MDIGKLVPKAADMAYVEYPMNPVDPLVLYDVGGVRSTSIACPPLAGDERFSGLTRATDVPLVHIKMTTNIIIDDRNSIAVKFQVTEKGFLFRLGGGLKLKDKRVYVEPIPLSKVNQYSSSICYILEFIHLANEHGEMGLFSELAYVLTPVGFVWFNVM